MSKEQTIRQVAYAIWEAEGRPDNAAQEHWLRAEKQVEQSQTPDGAHSSPKSKSARSAKAKPKAS